ncbi:MarR family transcriptional regulator [Clostridium botulinum]|nr:MarR family transcriptional regulator [Clostridium botulinum]
MSYDLTHSIHGILVDIMRLHFSSMSSLIDENLHPGQPKLLMALYNKDGQSQRELSDILHIKPATTNVMISRLEKGAFLRKEQDKCDQRATKIFLTEKGHTTIKNISKSLEYLDDICLKDFTFEEELTLRRLLSKLKDNLTLNCNNNN